MDPSSNRSRERSLSVSRPPPEGSRKEKEDSNDEASSESPKLRLLAARDDRSALPALVRSLVSLLLDTYIVGVFTSTITVQTDKSSPEALDACLAELSEEEHSSLWTSLQLFVAEEASKALAGEASEGEIQSMAVPEQESNAFLMKNTSITGTWYWPRNDHETNLLTDSHPVRFVDGD